MRIFFSTQLFIIVSTICLHPASATDLYVMESNRSWDYEKPPCKIATPDIVFTRYGPTVDIPRDVNITDDERVVVGYTRTFKVFQYTAMRQTKVFEDSNNKTSGYFTPYTEQRLKNNLREILIELANVYNGFLLYAFYTFGSHIQGCVWKNSLPAKVVKHTIQSDPGQCYTVCQTTHIGLHDGECYCLSDRPGDIYDTYAKCNSACVHPANTACGGSGWLSSYISLYRRVETSSKVSDDGKYCRMYDSWTSAYKWQYCNTKLYGLCETSATDDAYEWTKYTSWHQYTKVCFLINTYPATENIDKITSNAITGTRWIGEIKSRTIVSISNAEPDDLKYGYYGYISKHDNQFVLEFTKETSDSVLCLKDDDTTPTSLPTSTPTRTATTITTMSSALFSKSTMSSIISSQQMTTEVAVCVVVSLAVLLTVAVVILLVVRRKRKQNQHKGNPKALYSNGTVSKPSNADAKGLTNATYTDEFVPNKNAPRGNANCILEDQYNNSSNLGKTNGTTYGARVSDTRYVYEETVDLTEFGNRADNYFVLEKPIDCSNKHEMNTQDNIDDTYDTANTFNPINTTPNGNIYNTMSEFAEDTYNYAGEGNRQFHDVANPSVTGQATDNTYSHLSKDGERDNVYNTAGEENHQHQIDDTYNHI